jgi:hypothetical protein
MAKYVKTIKHLSDGTIAKVGMIVRWGREQYPEIENSVGRIERIKTNKDREIGVSEVLVVYPSGDISRLLSYLTIATKEERKTYYEQLKIHSKN